MKTKRESLCVQNKGEATSLYEEICLVYGPHPGDLEALCSKEN